MTYEEAKALKSFRSYCNCGGSAGLSERSHSSHPHMTWCAQYPEYEEWRAAIDRGAQGIGVAP